MKRFLALAIVLCASAVAVQAQVVDTTVCDVLSNPHSFDGKIIRVKGIAVAGFDQFVIKNGDCGQVVNGLWLTYPQGTKGKAGPVAVVQVQPAHNFTGTADTTARTPVTLDKSKDFKQFDNWLAQAHNRGVGMCLGCTRYEVSGTFVGRLDGVANAAFKRDASGKLITLGGFGNMNSYPARLVLQSVADIAQHEVDYSKSDEATKGDLATFSGNSDLYDPLAAAQKSALPLGSTPAGLQAQKAVGVFGKPGEHNGVTIAYGLTNELSAKDEGLGKFDSPDGVLYNCAFNLDRLQGLAQVRAIVHMGQHVTEMRAPLAGNNDAPPFVVEYNAWAVTIATAVSNGQKFLTLPGGYMVWNLSWPADDRTKNMDQALTGYLNKEMGLSK